MAGLDITSGLGMVKGKVEFARGRTDRGGERVMRASVVVAAALGGASLGLAGLLVNDPSLLDIPSGLAARLDAYARSRRVGSLAELIARYEEDRNQFLPMILPDPEIPHRHVGGVVSFVPEGFPKEFVGRLVPVVVRGVVRYPVRVQEDTRTRQRVVWNAAGEEVGRLPPPLGYDPWTFVKAQYGKELERGGKEAERLKAIFDPGRMVVEYELVARGDVGRWAKAEAEGLGSRNVQLAIAQMQTLSGGGGVEELQFVDSQLEEEGLRLTAAWPIGGLVSTNLDFFACTSLTEQDWSLAWTTSVRGDEGVYSWVTSVEGPQGFYALWTQYDGDRDGLSDGREKLLYKTNPANPDSDEDGLGDFDEVVVYGTDPCNADTDGDGVPDGWEVVLGLHPLTPSQLGEVGLAVWTPIRADE